MNKRGITEDGQEVEYPIQRTSLPPRVIGLKDALIVCSICTGIFGGLTVYILDSRINQHLEAHNNDPRAHPAAMEPVKEHMSRQSGEAGLNQELLERTARTEASVAQMRESLARIEERLAIHDQRKK